MDCEPIESLFSLLLFFLSSIVQQVGRLRTYCQMNHLLNDEKGRPPRHFPFSRHISLAHHFTLS